ncbi:molybdopterin-dependent oxidoreductase [Adlercreutzia sp. ZJ473]|uniref:molybdopterin-containing oxidoreductase family protein n=1 Tax=Adlercreutzia sp. ZJ473 TaxID=2722822 RepID=UPI0015550392|nr:molybdopterin-dependent oxidoreductase [Adlercreutzia sp. ZJ473]
MGSVIPLPDGGKLVKTNCFECHAKCGVLCEVNKDGELVSVKGNPEDPRSEGRLCSKGLSAKKILYDPERLRWPLRRKGERGAGDWERITWDEALDWLEGRIRAITDEHGAEAIAFGQGTGRGTNQWTARMGNAGGRVHHSLAPGNICLVPMMVQSIVQLGCFPIFDGCDFDHADCIVFWGANSVWTEATYSSGQIGRSRDRGAKLIVIDPFFEHPLAAKADHFLGVRPGADTYVAMAWLNVIISEDLYDHEFTRKHTNAPMLLIDGPDVPLNGQLIDPEGNPQSMLVFDRASGQLVDTHVKGVDEDMEYRGMVTLADGSEVPVKTVWAALKDLVAEWTPERASEMSWVPADVIRESARTYANAPAATINVFQGVEEQTNCRDTIQLILMIIAICGNLEKKGGNLSMPFWNQMFALSGPSPETAVELRMVDERAPGYLNGSGNTNMIFNAMLTDEPYPVRGYIMVQGNPLSWSEDTKFVRRALMSLDLLVCMDYYMSPTCELADLVLPSTHWTERDYLADEVCSEWVFAQQKAVEPLYERKSDVWFFRTLGHRLNPEWWPWETDEELFDWQLEQTHAGITWDALKEQWIHHLPMMPSRHFEENGFATPSGRAELYCVAELAVGAGPFPKASEPKESPYATPEVAKEYPLIGVTGRRYPVYYHSAYRGIPHLREIVPEPQVMFHTSVARELGVEYGEWVWIESPTGRITMKARPTDGVDPRVCVIPHGWWQGCAAIGAEAYPDDMCNVNVITGARTYNDEFMTPGLRSTLCRIVKKEGGE